MEIWKRIKENNNYEISNYGNFRNIKGKLLKLNINARGYLKWKKNLYLMKLH
jgi:hypothetical protein